MSNPIVTDPSTKVIVTGDTGATVVSVGIQGPTNAGVGVPTGGLTNQILVKNTATNYDTSWMPQSYEQTFTNATSVTVTHNLGHRPNVCVIDTANDECFGEIIHVSNNSLMITFSAPFSGTAICS